MKIGPCLFFNGRCEEAIAYYKNVFGVEQGPLMCYRERPETPSVPLPPRREDKVMHANLTIGETQLMASDGLTSDPPRFEGFSLSVTMPGADRARRVFDTLAEGGEVRMPLGETFFSP